MRPSSVAIVAVRGEVEVIDAVSADTAPPVPAGERDVEVDPAGRSASPWPTSAVGRAEHQARERERVDAHVEQGAAAERRVEHPAGRPARRRRSRGRRAPAAASRSRPRASRRRTSRITGWQAIHMASMQEQVAAAAAPPAPRRRRRLRVSGFSHSTCLPASKASRACSRWRACGRGDVDDVDVGVGDQLVVRRRGRAPRRRARGRTPRPTRASASRRPRSRRPGTARRLSAKLRAMRPVARMPQRVVVGHDADDSGASATRRKRMTSL